MTIDNDPSLTKMASEVRAVIKAEQHRDRFKTLVWLTILAFIIVALAWWFWPTNAKTQWQTYTLDRADMVLTAMATGNLQPKSEVSVGAEISGLVREVLVSENDEITQGQILAKFDTVELNVAMQQANAGLELAQASLFEATATLEEAVLNERRTKSLLQRELLSESSEDQALAARRRAEAKVAYAKASVTQAQASISQARTRLEKAVIKSPINGVVLKRSIEPGTTVAASFQTPVLFLLAQNLEQMELHVSMDEADVNMVAAGQSATFTVDAWSSREFEAQVLKVYLYPTVENNVVTYTTVLSVDNSEHLLQPGMTATATIKTGVREQALRVLNTAFRFTPPTNHESGSTLFSHPADRINLGSAASSNTIWILSEEQPKRVLVRTGYSDGRYTEILSDELSAGDKVLIDMLRNSDE